MAKKSAKVPRRAPAKIPKGIAMHRPANTETKASTAVLGSRFFTISETGTLYCVESPKSPLKTPVIYRKYCTGRGSFRPNFSSIAAITSFEDPSGTISRAGLPGAIRIRENAKTDTKNRTMIVCPIRFNMYSNILFAPFYANGGSKGAAPSSSHLA